jgi:hypothetical protein
MAGEVWALAATSRTFFNRPAHGLGTGARKGVRWFDLRLWRYPPVIVVDEEVVPVAKGSEG